LDCSFNFKDLYGEVKIHQIVLIKRKSKNIQAISLGYI